MLTPTLRVVPPPPSHSSPAVAAEARIRQGRCVERVVAGEVFVARSQLPRVVRNRSAKSGLAAEGADDVDAGEVFLQLGGGGTVPRCRGGAFGIRIRRRKYAVSSTKGGMTTVEATVKTGLRYSIAARPLPGARFRRAG